MKRGVDCSTDVRPNIRRRDPGGDSRARARGEPTQHRRARQTMGRSRAGWCVAKWCGERTPAARVIVLAKSSARLRSSARSRRWRRSRPPPISSTADPDQVRRWRCQHLNDRRRQAAAVDQRCTDHRFLRRRARISSWSRSHAQYSHRCFCRSQRDRRPAHSCSAGLTSLERSLRTIYLTVSSRVPNAHGRSERHATGELAHLGAVSISKPCRSNVPWCRPR